MSMRSLQTLDTNLSSEDNLNNNPPSNAETIVDSLTVNVNPGSANVNGHLSFNLSSVSGMSSITSVENINEEVICTTPKNRPHRKKIAPLNVTLSDEEDSPDAPKFKSKTNHVKEKQNHVAPVTQQKVPLVIPEVIQELTTTGNNMDEEEDQCVSTRDTSAVSQLRKDRVSSAVPISNQDHLAIATLEGNLSKVMTVVDAYTALFGANKGFDIVMSFRYDINERTKQVTKSPEARQTNAFTSTPKEEMFHGLSILHVACIFDMDPIVKYFTRFGLGFTLSVESDYGQSLVHSCCWFGKSDALATLLKIGAKPSEINPRGHTPMHLAALNGHLLCLEQLLKAGADPNLGDKLGNSPLHAAVLGNHVECAKLFFVYDQVDVNCPNFDGGTPLHYASTKEMIQLLLKHGANPNLQMKAPHPMGEGAGSTVFDMYLDTMPEGCLAIMNHYITTNGMSVGGSDLKVTYDYAVFRSKSRGREMEVLVRIVDTNHIDLLKHPICESFLHIKWLLVERYFYAYIIFYLLFLVSLNGLAVLDLSPVFEDNHKTGMVNARYVLAICSAVTVGFLALKNLILLLYSWRKFLTDIHAFFELVLIGVCITYVTLFLADVDHEVRHHFGSISLFCAWANFTFLLGKVPQAGIYIIMITRVTRELLKFLFLYASCIIGFALCFHIVSGHLESYFTDPLTSFVTTLAMMVGELNYRDVFAPDMVKYQGTTQIMFAVFLILVSIIIMNLLVGLAISNISNVFQKSGILRLKITVSLVKMMEDLIVAMESKMPFLFGTGRVFNYIKKRQTASQANLRSEDDSSDHDELIEDARRVFLYPNRNKDSHRLRILDPDNKEEIMLRYKLSPWIIENTFKVIRDEANAGTGSNVNGSGSGLDAKNDVALQKEYINKLVKDVEHLKKEIAAMSNHMKVKSLKT